MFNNVKPDTPEGADSALVLSLVPFKFATRPRKAAVTFARSRLTRFIAPAAAGRTGYRVSPGDGVESNISITHVRVGRIRTGSGVQTGLLNVMLAYLPAYWRILFKALQHRADTVYVTAIPLSSIALAHRCIYGSRLVLDLNERPGLADVAGSVFSWVSRLEPFYLSVVGRWFDLVCVVTPGHVQLLESFPLRAIHVVRNAPLRSWFKSADSDVERARDSSGAISYVCIGTIAPGRYYLEMVQAVALARDRGALLALDLYGPAIPEFLERLQDSIERYGVSDIVTYRGTLDDSEVCGAYRKHDLAIAIYDPSYSASDSLSNKILESVASGTPVLAGDLAENRNFLAGRGVGTTVSLSVEHLAAAFVGLSFRDIDAWQANARAVGKQLNWENEFERVLEVVR